jgi:purine-binding chemotaxis protein CheW
VISPHPEDLVTTKDAKPKRTKARSSRSAETPPEVTPADRSAPEVETEAPVDSGELITDPPGRLVVFGMDGQRYALPMDSVQEIQQLVAVSEMPGASPAVIGVINLRGQVVPAIDLRVLVGLPARDYDLDTPMILARTRGGLVALVVDQVEDVVEVPDGAMQAASRVHALADRLLGVCRLESGLVFVFDAEALVPTADLTVGGAEE